MGEMRISAGRRTVLLLSALLVVAVVGEGCGCSWGSGGARGSGPSAGPTSTPVPRPEPNPTNPLTGTGAPPGGPVIAVKIDNVAAARPQVGLAGADVVYVEMVEGGLTRLVAVYASRRPRTVGPVRSVRSSDPELLAHYGPIVLAFSGGAAGVVAHFRRSPLVDGSTYAHAGAYRRLAGRPAPHNLMVDLYLLARALPRAGGVRDVGFRWALGDPRLSAARRASRLAVRMGGTLVSFAWDGPHHVFDQTADGGPVREAGGRPLATPNVLVQLCPVTVDRTDVDVVGNPAQYTHTVGSGAVLLFRDGKVIAGRWRRTQASAATEYLDEQGQPLLLRPGGVWVLHAPQGSLVHYG
ncbi:MAG TPA: DUF3048 domain-containing protein [Mycobacteriales bacterium]|nr:DUF3048 domain-containing protein [Mycobacteriales bacterium]